MTFGGTLGVHLMMAAFAYIYKNETYRNQKFKSKFKSKIHLTWKKVVNYLSFVFRIKAKTKPDYKFLNFILHGSTLSILNSTHGST